MGVSPGPAAIALYQQISSGELAAKPSPIFPFPPASATHTNLPTWQIPFVGRRLLLGEIQERLQDPDCRLLTLLGPGGSGKTRLAAETAARQVQAFPDGVFFAPLAGLPSGAAITPAVSQASGFKSHEEGDPQQQVLDYLRNKTLLLVLDNFEHLLAEANVVAEILRLASRVKILVTSQIRLNLSGEHLVPVSGMNVPEQPLTSMADALQYSSFHLFMEGAQRVAPAFTPTLADLEHIQRICRLVQGSPLAILLAAGWMGLLFPAEIAVEIASHSLDFLESEWQDVPERQRSLRAVFEYSWRLLSERERQVLAALTVFRGDFSYPAAQQVCGAVLRDLLKLVNHSLLERTSEGRYQLHEMVRQYAAEKLSAQPGDEQSFRDRHSLFFSDFLAQREDRLFVKNEQKAIDEVACEFDNLRLAWNWAVEHGWHEVIDRCQLALARFVTFQGQYQEGKEMFAHAGQCLRMTLQSGREGIDERNLRLVIARLDYNQAHCCLYLQQWELMDELYQPSIQTFREFGDLRGEADVLTQTGYQNGAEDFNQAIRLREQIGDWFGKALSQLNLCQLWIGNHAEFERAMQLNLECLAVFKDASSPFHTGRSYDNLGLLHLAEGLYPEAERYFRYGLEIYEKLAAQYQISQSIFRLGLVMYHMGETELGKQLL